jgi:hypothetical protein
MWHIALSVCVIVTSLVAQGRPAAACSVGPSFEPRDHTQLLILGRVRSVAIGAPSVGNFVDALVTVDVLHTFRGTTSSPLVFVDRTSVFVEQDPLSQKAVSYFRGGSGACGTIDDDPVGKYVLIALARDNDVWRANRLYGAIYSERLDTEAYRGLLQRHYVPVPFLAIGQVGEPREVGAILSP